MEEYRKGSHTVYDVKYHFVWVTKYRYAVLRGDVAIRLRDLVREICQAREIQVVRGAIAPNHVHVLLSCPPNLAPSKVIQYIKGRSSKKLQDEYPSLRKKYWGQHLWARGYFCATVGAVDEETIKKYIESQKWDDDGSDAFKIEPPPSP